MDTSSNLLDLWIKYKGTISPNSIPCVIRTDLEDNWIGSNIIEVPNDYKLSNLQEGIVYICIYATYITIKSGPKTKLPHMEVYINKVLDQLKLTRFDKVLRKTYLLWNFYAYDRALGEFRLPRYALNILIQSLVEQNCEYRLIDENYEEGNEIDLKINDDWKLRDYQKPVFDWFCNSSIGALRATQLNTGLGKTFVAICAAIALKRTIFLVCSGLGQQWIDNFFKITNIKEDELFVIQGHPSLVNLFKNLNNSNYKVYIASTETLRNWIANVDNLYIDVPTYDQFLSICKIGTKIVDEFHLNFSAISTIDLHSNVANNIYLSATPERSDKISNKIFNIVFPNKIIFQNNVYDKYVNCTIYSYQLYLRNPKRLTNKFGYSHAKMEFMICADEGLRYDYFYKVLKPIIDIHYINKFKSGKLLILIHTVQLVRILVQYCEYNYPGKVVKSYISEDPESNLSDADIIISTPKSSGVGVDIKELVCLINTISMASEPLIKQVFGRLRKLPDKRTPEFIDIYNKNLFEHVRHKRIRERIYKRIALKCEELEL